MKKVILPQESKRNTIREEDIEEDTPIFARKDGKLAGMIVKESPGWILRIGGIYGSHGHWPTRLSCMQASLQFGCEFYVEDEGR